MLLSLGLAVPGTAQVDVQDNGKRVTVKIDGELFTEYRYKEEAKPFFYPVLGPGQTPMTRGYPMEKKPNEAKDHVHQRSLWYAIGDINGIDFWSEPNPLSKKKRKPKRRGQIIHEKFFELKSGENGIIKSANRWVGPDGKTVMHDERSYRFSTDKHARIIDFKVVLQATEGEIKIGETKEGCLGFRVPATLRLEGPVAKGKIRNSRGDKDRKAWGKRAEWVVYSGPVNGKNMSVAILDHPDNFRHPTYWHARHYGLVAANPFGHHDFDKTQPKGSGALKIEKNEEYEFAYRIYLFETGHADVKKAWKIFRKLCSCDL